MTFFLKTILHLKNLEIGCWTRSKRDAFYFLKGYHHFKHAVSYKEKMEREREREKGTVKIEKTR